MASGGSDEAALGNLLFGAFAGRASLDTHAGTTSGGEIRGFLIPLPEGSASAMPTAGCLAAAALTRRRLR